MAAHVGGHLVSQEGSEGSRPLGPAGGAQTAALTAEGKQKLLLALWATDTGEAAAQDAAFEIGEWFRLLAYLTRLLARGCASFSWISFLIELKWSEGGVSSNSIRLGLNAIEIFDSTCGEERRMVMKAINNFLRCCLLGFALLLLLSVAQGQINMFGPFPCNGRTVATLRPFGPLAEHQVVSNTGWCPLIVELINPQGHQAQRRVVGIGTGQDIRIPGNHSVRISCEVVPDEPMGCKGEYTGKFGPFPCDGRIVATVDGFERRGRVLATRNEGDCIILTEVFDAAGMRVEAMSIEPGQNFELDLPISHRAEIHCGVTPNMPHGCKGSFRAF